MKKTLAAVAVLGAFAGSALAADVTLYGKVDLGLQYQHKDADTLTLTANAYDSTDGFSGDAAIVNAKSHSWGLKSGSNSGSRFGLKGSEQISEDLTVGFQLEHGFKADNGGFGDKDRMFNREARLYVKTAFGELGMGRMGGLDSGSGSYNLMGDAGAMGTGWGSTIGSNSAVLRGMSSRMDNTITYKSPAFAGVTLLAQASLGANGDDEASHDTDRYYALGAKGEWNALEAALVVSTTDYKRDFANKTGEDNSLVVGGYAAYDFGVAKTTLGAQYYDNLVGNPVSYAVEFDKALIKANKGDYKFATAKDKFVADLAENAGYAMTKGYGVTLGAEAPVASGTLYTSLGYGSYELVQDSAIEGEIMNFGVGYKYPLSKRTYVYGAAGYTQAKVEGYSVELKSKTAEVVSGLVHNF